MRYLYNQSFVDRQFRDLVRPHDFKKYNVLGSTASVRNARLNIVIREAIQLCSSASNITRGVKHLRSAGCDLYLVTDMSEELVLRKIARNISTTRRMAPTNRNQLIEELVHHLEDGVKYRVYRLDIEKFYESIDQDQILKIVEKDAFISRKTLGLLREFFLRMRFQFAMTWIPRGIGLSSILSDLSLSSLEFFMKRSSEVYYFGRFVDDMVVITSGEEDQDQFLEKIQKLLGNLKLNKAKTKIDNILAFGEKQSVHPARVQFDFLGYRFDIQNHCANKGSKTKFPTKREIKISIAEKKIEKIKKRIVKSFLSFENDGNFSLLKDRVRLLTTSYQFYDPKRGRKMLCGLRHSYPAVNSAHENLLELDNFLVWAISNRHKRHSPHSLTPHQKKELRSFLFRNGYSNRVTYFFSGKRLAEIQGCWKYV